MRKPINEATMARLVSNIRFNLNAFYEGDSHSVDYAEIVMGILTGLMKDGHIIHVSVWPQNEVTQIWGILIDDVELVRGGVLFEEAVPKLLKKGRG